MSGPLEVPLAVGDRVRIKSGWPARHAFWCAIYGTVKKRLPADEHFSEDVYIVRLEVKIEGRQEATLYAEDLQKV